MEFVKILNLVSMDTKLSFSAKIRCIGVVDIIYIQSVPDLTLVHPLVQRVPRKTDDLGT